MIAIVILFAIPSVYLLTRFLFFIFGSKKTFNLGFYRLTEVVALIGYPWFYLGAIDEQKNECCNDSASFSPAHKLTILVIIVLMVLVYFYSSYQKKLLPPLAEVLINALLVAGVVLNIFIAIQIGWLFSLFGILPVVLLFLMLLIKNQQRCMQEYTAAANPSENWLAQLGWKILSAQPLLKYPVLLLVSLPLLLIVISLLLLFGQKPDALIRAFTDTYKHGFSQLNYECDNIDCGGHFLCSVAAKGHQKMVKPIRYGERAGGKIICNRQLLIANAFEELLEEHFPSVHKIIRLQYNKVGEKIHRHYHFFNIKLVADTIFVLMKPPELFFLLVLYLADRKPENRIAAQYLRKQHKEQLRRLKEVTAEKPSLVN